MNVVKRIKIEELTLGSYVKSVTKQRGDMRIKQCGWVRTLESKQYLIDIGIEEVEVDESLHYELTQSKDKPADIQTTIQVEQPKPEIPFSSELDRAKDIIIESKRVQRTLLSDIQKHNEVAREPLEYVASCVVESIDRNPNALVYLTQLREKSSLLLEDAIRCATLLSLFGKHLKYEKDTLLSLAMGALLHNIGMVKIPSAIVNKTTPLTEKEQAVMQTFIAYNRSFLDDADDIPELSKTIALNYCERLDGSGYPFRLGAEQIDEFTRMMSIVAVYNSLTAGVNATGPINAYRNMMEQAPAKLDPELLQNFIKCIGIYPAGTLVRLKSGKVGIVTEANAKQPKRPKIKIFYNAKYQHHVSVKVIDLAQYTQEEIEACISSEKYGLELENYM